jgi:hypothetical protein
VSRIIPKKISKREFVSYHCYAARYSICIIRPLDFTAWRVFVISRPEFLRASMATRKRLCKQDPRGPSRRTSFAHSVPLSNNGESFDITYPRTQTRFSRRTSGFSFSATCRGEPLRGQSRTAAASADRVGCAREDRGRARVQSVPACALCNFNVDIASATIFFVSFC